MDEVVRVLHVTGGIGVGGIETWLLGICRHLSRRNVQMEFLNREGAGGSVDHEIRTLGARIHPMPRGSDRRAWEAEFARILREEGPYTAVHIHRRRFDRSLKIAWRCGVPVRVVSCHTTAEVDGGLVARFRRLRAALRRRRSLRHCTVGLACSADAAANRFGPRWREEGRFRVHPYGLDLAPLRDLPDPATVRKELGLPADAFVIGSVGRVHKQKNLPFLVDVAAEVMRREPRAWLLLVGDGPLRAEIEARIEREGVAERSVLTGERRDVTRMLAALDVFVFPSIYEGLGIVGVEAQATGRRLVRADVLPDELDVVPELVTKLSLRQPVGEWADVILALGSRPAPMTPQEAFARVAASPFNIENAGRELEAIYRSSGVARYE